MASGVLTTVVLTTVVMAMVVVYFAAFACLVLVFVKSESI